MLLRACSITFVAVAVHCGLVGTAWAAEHDKAFRAGASAVDVSPPAYPVRVNGMFTERSAEEAHDVLYARAMALDDGVTRLVFCVVDTCMMPRELIDAAKNSVAKQTGLDTAHMMVSATHTHSAPAAMSCLGSRMDPDYAAWLPGKVAESMIAALQDLQPARIGWASVDVWAHTHNRRWVRRADKMFDDPFGDRTVRAHMHPGYESTDVIGPSGPVDPELSVLAVETPDGKPLAMLANYSQHYFRSPLLSADYFGVFAWRMAALLKQSSSEGPFVAMMSQGTSGDLMWMDYGSPKKDPTLETYSVGMAANAFEAYNTIEWQDHVPLGMVEKKVRLRYRISNAERLAWAQDKVAAMDGALPKNLPDVYAHEALYLHEKQSAELKLQAIRIGDLTIATLPNEVYALTGLKLKAQAPLGVHFNIELANGAEGYIPPPEQFTFGGYTTWPARTAGLEVKAEPTIVETLLGALEEVSGKPRAVVADEHGPYARAILDANPVAYWRLNEFEGRTLRNAVEGAPDAQLTGGAALYLPGIGSGTGWGKGEVLRPSAFSGPNQINRAVHFADGALEANVPMNGADRTIAFWFWLGEKSGASEREGTLLELPNGGALQYKLNEEGAARLLSTTSQGKTESVEGRIPLFPGEWHFIALVQDTAGVRAYVNAVPEPEFAMNRSKLSAEDTYRFAKGLEGKLDEIAIFERALSHSEITQFWHKAGSVRPNG
jgi:hypothetical protein